MDDNDGGGGVGPEEEPKGSTFSPTDSLFCPKLKTCAPPPPENGGTEEDKSPAGLAPNTKGAADAAGAGNLFAPSPLFSAFPAEVSPVGKVLVPPIDGVEEEEDPPNNDEEDAVVDVCWFEIGSGSSMLRRFFF